METEKKINSYYKETIKKLIDKYKIVIEQCLEVIEEPIDAELGDEKKLNVLKAKRQASEDAKYYAQQVDVLEDELSDNPSIEKKVETTTTSWVKRNSN